MNKISEPTFLTINLNIIILKLFRFIMLLFGHIGVTLGVFIGLGILDPQLKNVIDPKYLAVGSPFA